MAGRGHWQRAVDEAAHWRHAIHLPRTLGEAAADAVARGMGSWRFIFAQTALVIGWIAMNSLQATGRLHLDPFPFILLNLAFSTQAAYAAPILQMAANRQDAKDRLRDDREAAEITALYAINQEQMAILREIQALAARLDEQP